MAETVTLVPDGTVTNVGTVITGAATAHLALSDNSDASYLTQDTTNDRIVVSVGTWVMPANKKILAIRNVLRQKHTHAAGAWNIDTYNRIEKAPGVYAALGAYVTGLAEDVLATTYGAWEFNHGVDTQAEIDALTIEHKADAFTNTNRYLYKSSVELYVLTQPVAGLTAPAATGAALAPLFSWSYTGNGEPQKKFYIYVYTKAAVDAVGFAIGQVAGKLWESGVTTSTPSVQMPAGILAAGTQYVAFIAVAKDFNGGDYWSPWSSRYDFTTNVAPVVDVTGPATPVTNTNRPTTTWTYTDAENNPQDAFEVAVFTAAQYGIGGFDPAVSPATYRSGTVLGADLSHKINFPLPNDTYRSYVRARQGSDSIWSAWDFFQFVENVAPPNAPIFTAVADNPNGRVTLTIQKNAAGVQPEWYLIERSLGGVGPWEPVRGFENGPLAYVANTIYTHYDYESFPNKAYSYRGTVYEQTLDDTVASPYTTVAGVTVALKKVWVKSPLDPTKNVMFPVRETWLARSKPKARTIHKPIGRDKPMVVRGEQDAEAFGMTFTLVGDGKEDTLMAALNSDLTLLVQTSRRQWYVEVMDIQVDDHLWDELRGEPEGAAEYVSVSFQEVDSP